MEAVFAPVGSSLRGIRDSVKQAMLRETNAQSFAICSEQHYYPGMLDLVLRDAKQIAALLSSISPCSDAFTLSCIALWDLETREGVALCALEGHILATYLPLLTREQLQAEQHCLNELHTLAVRAKDMPLYIDQYILPGRYTLADLLQCIR